MEQTNLFQYSIVFGFFEIPSNAGLLEAGPLLAPDVACELVPTKAPKNLVELEQICRVIMICRTLLS